MRPAHYIQKYRKVLMHSPDSWCSGGRASGCNLTIYIYIYISLSLSLSPSLSACPQNHSMQTYEHKTSRDSCKDQRRLYHADADTGALYSFNLKPCAWNRYRWWTRLNSGNAWNSVIVNTASGRHHYVCMRTRDSWLNLLCTSVHLLAEPGDILSLH